MIAALYPWVKSIHLIFVIAWMAGMLMYPRLKIYQLQSAPGQQQFETMKLAADRLRKIILSPSIIAAWVLGIALLWMTNWAYLTQGWFHVKLLFALIISAFHGIYIGMGKRIDAGDTSISEKRLRLYNELPFLAMIVIIIMVIVKPF